MSERSDVVVQPDLDPGIPETENDGDSEAAVELVRAAASARHIVATSGINQLITLEKPQKQTR